MKPFLRRKKVIIYSDYLSFNYVIYIDANNSLSVCKMKIKRLKQLLEEDNIEIKKRDNQILALKSSLQTAQDKYTEKSNVSINNKVII